MQFLWKYIGDLIGKGLEWYIIFEFILYSVPYLIPRALPLAVLLSSIMTYGNLGERYELVAVKSAGVSLLRTMRPMLVVMMMISGMAFYSSNILIPRANLSWGALFYDVTNKKPAMNIQDGIFFKDLQGYAIRVGHKHKDNQTLEDVLIYARHENAKGTTIIMAKRGKMEFTDNERFLKLTLIEGKRYEEMTDNPGYDKTFPHNVMSFDSYNMAIDLSELELKRSNPELFKDNYEMLNLDELQDRIDSLDDVLRERRDFLAAYLDAYYHFKADTLEPASYAFDEVDYKGKSYYEVITNSYTEYLTKPDTLKKRVQPARDTNVLIPLNKKKPGSSALLPEKLAQAIDAQKTDNTVATQEFEPEKDKLSGQHLITNATQSTRNLMRIVESTKKEVRQISERQRRYAIQWHKKFTLAFSCLLLFFVGAPLGAIIRKGGFGAPLIAAILMFIAYFILQTVGEKLAREGVLEVWAGAWFSSLIFIPLALFLTYKASTDSALFDREAYVRMFRRIGGLFKRAEKA